MSFFFFFSLFFSIRIHTIHTICSRSLRGATRRARQLSISSKVGNSTTSGDPNASSKRSNTSYDWIDLQRKAAATDKESITSGNYEFNEERMYLNLSTFF